MSAREEFGKYTLLKKLAEDPLGETFRAGRLGPQGLEQVVLLRVFNGSGLDSERLWSAILSRQGLGQALKSPNIGHGVDAGRVHGLPYLAYDYVSGKNLAALAAQATHQGSPFPVDHALLVAERIALALSAAYETRQGDERILHGLPLPHLAVLSNEGETRLLGFEAGPGLAAQAGAMVPELRHYASPELRAGQPLTKGDDVFTVGAILYELLTGTPLPENAPGGYGDLLARAQLAAEGGAVPPTLVHLLQRSLAPREERISDIGLWHKAVSRLMAEGRYAATTFNLAFFMHNLFREDIEREGREIEQERTLELPRVAPVPEPPPATRPDSRPPASARPAATATADDTLTRGRYAAVDEPASEGSKKGLFIGLAAVLLLGAAGAGWYFMGTGKAATPPVAEPDVVATAEPTDAVPQEGPTKEELQAQIDRLLEERTQAKLGELKQEYDKQIATMRDQLKQAQERPAPPRPEPAPAPAPKPVVPEPTKEEPVAAKEPEPTPAPVTPTPEPAPEPVPTPPVAQPEPAPVKTVKVGDLVSLGTPGAKPPAVLKRAQATYPRMAERFGKEAVVDVKVLVDENGRVINAEVAGAKAGYGFDEEALRAARSTTYQPATKDGVRVRMWTTLRIAFKPKS